MPEHPDHTVMPDSLVGESFGSGRAYRPRTDLASPFRPASIREEISFPSPRACLFHQSRGKDRHPTLLFLFPPVLASEISFLIRYPFVIPLEPTLPHLTQLTLWAAPLAPGLACGSHATAFPCACQNKFASPHEAEMGKEDSRNGNQLLNSQRRRFFPHRRAMFSRPIFSSRSAAFIRPSLCALEVMP